MSANSSASTSNPAIEPDLFDELQLNIVMGIIRSKRKRFIIYVKNLIGKGNEFFGILIITQIEVTRNKF